MRVFAFRALHRWARQTTSRVDDVILATLRGPSVIWIIQGAVIAGLHLIHFRDEQIDSIARRVMHALFVLSLTMGAVRE